MKKQYLILVTLLLILTGCQSKTTLDTIVVGGSITPHAEILKVIEDDVKEQGYTLVIREFTDYVLPNQALQQGDLDANYFQHGPYLEDFNQKHNTTLVSVGTIHYEPFGLYSTHYSSLDNIQENTRISVPNDGTNEARALLLLESAGLIKVDINAGLNATIRDIVDNPLNLQIIEMEAAQLSKSLDDVDFSVINGNYALQAKLNVREDALLIEDEESFGAKTYGNVLAVKAGHEESKKTKVLLEALQSKKVEEYITQTYDNAVIYLKP